MRRTVAALGLALGACGTSSAQGPGANHATAPDGDEQVCHEEMVTGSAIPRRVCRTQDQIDADRQGAHDLIGGPHASPSSAPPPPPSSR